MAEKLTYFNDPTGPDGTLEPGDDLKPEVKETLANYLSAKTKEPNGNKFPISPHSVAGTATADGNGITPDLNTSDTGGSAERVFAPHSENPQLSSYTNTDLQYGITGEFSLENIVKKGKSSAPPKALDGNTLYDSVNKEPSLGAGRSGLFSNVNPQPISPILKRTNVITSQPRKAGPGILSHNRFNADNPFYPEAETLPDVENRHVSSIQTEFGVYDPNAKQITNTMMRKVGKSLMFRATGELLARGQGADPETSSVNVTSLLPGEAQLGITRIDSIDMEAREAFRELFGEEANRRLESNTPNNVQSYGQLNNPVDLFTSLAPAGMIALAFALILAAQITMRGILATIAVITGGKTTKANQLARDADGRPFLGDFRLQDIPSEGFPSFLFISPKALGLQDTNFEFVKAATQGIDVFFGATSTGGNILGAVGNVLEGGFIRATEAPGFYAIFVRNITRSVNTIANSISNVTNSGNIVDTANGIIGLLDTIRSSKVISALNIFATIGDRALTLEARGVDITKFTKGANRMSFVDELPDNAATHVMKSRSGGSLKLAWRTASTPSKFILPQAILSAGVSLGGAKSVNPAAMFSMEGNKTRVVEEESGRIPSVVIEEVERELDSEYVPFYFHDLRTNEIISFHAFLEDIQDAFVPNYESSEAYGRVEKTYSYKGTDRQISMAFFVVATNPNDFDEMWMKVNKLITMVYPQYSRGLEVKTDKGNKFIQPFSQFISASPLIRLRLGDLFKTNYSRFSLARLFGLGTKSFDVKDPEPTINTIRLETEMLKLQLRYELEEFEVGDILRLKANAAPGAVEHALGYQPAIEEGGLGSAIASAASAVIGMESDTPPPLILTSPAKVEIISSREIGYPGGRGKIKIWAVALVNEDTSISPAKELKYVVNGSDLFTDPEDVRAKALKVLGTSEEQLAATETSKFFDPENNAIVRSFESTKGKGLAGFITNLSISELNSGNWATETFNSRAPKCIKVSITFAPIHDISPGLDSNGFNRAPIYNVGLTSAIAGDSFDPDQENKTRFEQIHRDINKRINRTK